MADEFSSLVAGAIAGGLVSFAFDGVKAWLNKPKLTLAASIGISTGLNRPFPQFTFNLTVTNTGGETIHMVKCGILGPCVLNPDQLKLCNELDDLERSSRSGWRKWIRRKRNLFSTGLFSFAEVIPLAPGQPFFIEGEEVFDHFVLELNGEAFAFAEDSLGRRFTCRFKVPYDSIIKSRTPEQQAEVEAMLAEWRKNHVRPGLALSVTVNQPKNQK